MFKSYLTVAWRNLARQKLYSTINILGLTVGLSSFLLIFLYLQDELSYDQMHPEYERVYRFSYLRAWDTGEIGAMATSGATWGPRYAERFPEVEAYARLAHSGYPGYVNRENSAEAFMEPKFYWVDPSLLDLLHFPLKLGTKEAAFSQVENVLISESAATKYFGKENPIGQVIEFNHNAGTAKLTVSGVYFDPPDNTHVKPEFMGSLQRLADLYIQAWNYNPLAQDADAFMFTYLKVSDPAVFEKIAEDWRVHLDGVLDPDQNGDPENYKTTKFTAVADMHFEPEMKWELEAPADASYVPMFVLTALLVLIIACINFMNLATARSAKRAREVGLRKTLGSGKRQLIIQFYGESFMIAFVAVVISLGIVALVLPYFNDLTAKSFDRSYLFNLQTLGILLALTVAVGLISGSYPALYLSNFKPMAALRGLSTSGKAAEHIRRGLVIFQFSVSIILIISTLVVYNQLSLIHDSKLGQDKDRILSIRLGGFGLGNGWQTFRDEVANDSRFESVTLGNHLPRLPHFGLVNRTFRFPERDNEEMEWNKFDVDFNFPETFDLEFIAGRNFDAKIRSDSTGVILNESAVARLNIDPQDAIGMTVRDRMWNPQLQQQVDVDGKVIAVVRDFPYKSVKTTIEPLAMWGTPSRWDRIMYVKMSPGDYQSKIDILEEKWKTINAGFPMENWFMDFEFGRLYENERRMSRIFTLFSGITIFIAILGLFALASYVTEQRKKEIGVRKVLGATTERLMRLLLSHFFILIAVAFVISVPVAWYLMDAWLSGFVYRVSVSLWVIAVAGISVALVTLITVGLDTYRAAMSNPVKVLRTE